MGTFRENLLPTVLNLRKLPSESFDIRTFRVYLVSRVWDGGEPHMGSYTDTATELLPRPKVIEQSDGATLVVGPITPSNVSGGYTPAQLNPADVGNTEFFYRVDGPFASGFSSIRYKCVHIDTAKAFGYKVTLEARERLKPF